MSATTFKLHHTNSRGQAGSPGRAIGTGLAIALIGLAMTGMGLQKGPDVAFLSSHLETSAPAPISEPLAPFVPGVLPAP
jgi:hypothetical protein